MRGGPEATTVLWPLDESQFLTLQKERLCFMAPLALGSPALGPAADGFPPQSGEGPGRTELAWGQAVLTCGSPPSSLWSQGFPSPSQQSHVSVQSA